jgi:hypothetical protein
MLSDRSGGVMEKSERHKRVAEIDPVSFDHRNGR